MKLGLLIADHLDTELQSEFGGYDRIFQSYFTDYVSSDLTYEPFDLLQGNVPEQPRVCDAYLITGSKRGVYDKDAWIPRLLQLVRQIYAARVPLLGICFGHQAIAQALGGEVKNSTAGWLTGMQQYQLVQPFPWMSQARTSFKMLASHQDQVTRLPTSAVNCASSESCKFAGFYVGDTVLTLQSHPEFEAEFLRRVLDSRKDQLGLSYQPAIDSLAGKADREFAGSLVREFLGL